MWFYEFFLIMVWIYVIILSSYTILLGKWLDYILDRLEEIEKRVRNG